MQRLCVFCGSSPGRRPIHAESARFLGKIMAARGLALVYGGGHVGLMGVLADAVLEAGGEVIGVIPQSMVDKELAHTGISKLHIVGTMHERKALMADLADGFAALPGAFGTADELFDPPPGTPAVGERRRAERVRLAALALPVAFTAPWQPVQMRPVLNRGDRLTGIGASPGTARGLARVVTPETVDDLQPGEVLVAHVTDVGYTPMFGHAAAVVTDIGGLMSHAAVVAREFGIPAVVDTAEATRRMADGMVLEVDGATGVVTVIS